MRESTRLFLWSSFAFVLGCVLTAGTMIAYQRGGFVKDTWENLFNEPRSPTRYLAWVVFVLVFVAVPFGIREMVADRRFVKEERAMRAARPDDAVTEYVGPEGRGYLFDGPGGRTLLLEPAAGLGVPRVVELPPIPPAPSDPEGGATDGNGVGRSVEPSPEGSDRAATP